MRTSAVTTPPASTAAARGQAPARVRGSAATSAGGETVRAARVTAAGAPPELQPRPAASPRAAATSVISTTADHTCAPARGATSARAPVRPASTQARRSEATPATTVGSMPRKYGVTTAGATTASTTTGTTVASAATSRRRRDGSMATSLPTCAVHRTRAPAARDVVSSRETGSQIGDLFVTEDRYGCPHEPT